MGEIKPQAAYDGRVSRPSCPMQRLIQAPNIAIATVWCDLLCEAGMPATVQRQYLSSAAGQLPPSECLPEIWLEHGEHLDRARTLLDA